jgi:hypothetical protein
MSATVARSLMAVDTLEVSVLVDNGVDPLSSVPEWVTGENTVLRAKGLMLMSGHARCCAAHGLSLVITARIGSDIQILLFDAGPEAYTVARNGERLRTPFGEGYRRLCVSYYRSTAGSRCRVMSTKACLRPAAYACRMAS